MQYAKEIKKGQLIRDLDRIDYGIGEVVNDAVVPNGRRIVVEDNNIVVGRDDQT